MNNLRASIDTLFRRLNSQDIIDSFYGIGKKRLSSSIDRDKFITQAFYHLPEYSHDEVGNVLNKVNEDWGVDNDVDSNNKKFSVFSLLHRLSACLLVEDNFEPLVEYEHLLRWREISHLLGEDIFTTCFFAYKDRIENNNRHYFAWRPVISTNNLRLKEMLKKGMAENHFHLKGSAPIFDLTWLSLMNHIAGRKSEFDKFEKDGKLEANSVFAFDNESSDLYTQCIKAACIRVFLFKIINDVEDSESAVSSQDLEAILRGAKEESIYRLADIQSEIENLQKMYSCRLHPTMKHAFADYAIPKNIGEQSFNGNVILVGERFFLYNAFQAVENKGKLAKYQDLFYAYLVIKAQMREELIQVNKNTGFTNFRNYESRKGCFLDGNSDIYELAITKLAVSASRDNQEIRSFEARITPKDSVAALLKTMNTLDRNLESNIFSEKESSVDDCFNESTGELDCFYTTHFIKTKDKRVYKEPLEKINHSVIPRDYKCRITVKKQAQAIVALRNGLYTKCTRILGIDAASSEIDARPEVFAQAYRFLKNHKIDGDKQLLLDDIKIPKLGATFHAGEDFLDILDGLRAIDEAVKFLNLGQGDRIGHALALGVDVKAYYKFKSYTLMKPKQVHLDDVVWLLSRISKYGLYEYSDVVSSLKRDYCLLFHEIYCDDNNHSMLEHEVYYEAWKLRGDCPSLYETGNYLRPSSITFWERCGYNDMYPSKENIREIDDVSKLYHDYHFNPRVKEMGDKIKQVKVSKRFVQVVAEVQKYMQKEIARKHIAIETNPSSNLLIGPFSRYDEHPIMNFFNLGLEIDPQKIKDCPQLFVSINTDDQGVFNTYLENEYALMARALEKVEDEDGNPVYHSAMIYDWLDRIRQMGLEMSFKK